MARELQAMTTLNSPKVATTAAAPTQMPKKIKIRLFIRYYQRTYRANLLLSLQLFLMSHLAKVCIPELP